MAHYRDRLAKADPANAGWQRNLAASYDEVGDVRTDQGDLAAALASYQASLAIADRLAKADPSNLTWQVDLAQSYGKVGDVQQAQGDLPAALASYQSGLAVRLCADAGVNPGNAGWRRALFVAYIRVGNVQSSLGDLPAALTSDQASLAIMDQLAKSDPGNADWRSDLTFPYNNIGYLLFELGRAQEALDDFNAAAKIGAAANAEQIHLGRALAKLYTNDAAGAADDAAMAVKLEPANPHNVIWLHIARARAGQNDADELAANAKAVDRGKWPWPIVALFLGSTTPDAARTAAASAEPSAHVGQSCEADFFIGVYQSERGAPAAARPLFQSAVDHCPPDYTQHAAAAFELKRLDAQAGTPAK